MRRILIAVVLILAFVADSEARGRRGRRTNFQPTPVESVDSKEVGKSSEALAEVNATRSARGLAPFIQDEGLTIAAQKCAAYRAARGIEGHVNDFSFVPAGTSATAAGCAAWPQEMGWGSCCTYENWRYAGAAWVIGRDGRRYMHLFVR